MQFDIRRFDVYRKVPKDLTQPTVTGAFISIFSAVFIVFLMTSELLSFLQVDIVSDVFVDVPKGSEKIPVHLNITLPKLKCDFLGLDIQDQNGRHEVGFMENTVKVPVNDGNGCRFEGSFPINRVPGNFHLSTHGARQQPKDYDMSHFLHSLHFGDIVKRTGAFSSLDNINWTTANALASHDYVVKVVPTILKTLSGLEKHTFQYSYAHKDYLAYGRNNRVVPAVWFKYDMSPITIKYVEKRKPFYHFVTTFCAIIGGTFTVAGIIDGIIFTAAEIFRKAEIGKLS